MMLCRPASVLPVEVVVRGYLVGLRLEGVPGDRRGLRHPRCPPGLRESDRLPEPIFTPATKAELGEHDENIDFDGRWPARRSARDASPSGSATSRSRLYGYAARRRRAARASCSRTRSSSSGVGRRRPASCCSSTRSLTPDSSRFWDAATYEPGRPQASFDKQFVRDWLETQPWDKTAPGPELPADVVDGTRARYVEAFERITGASFERYLQEDVDRPMTSFRFAVNVTAQARHPRSAGPGRRGQPRPPRDRRASAPSGSGAGSS